MTEADECAEMVYQRHMDIYPIDTEMANALAYVYFSHETHQIRELVRDALLSLNAKAEEALNQRFRNKANDEWASDEVQIDADAKVSQTEDGSAWVAAWVLVNIKESSND
jgi:hypothetical protein